MLQVLQDFINDYRFDKIQLFISSREYFDIKETMSMIASAVSMSKPHVEANRKTYVTAKLNSTRRFRFWPPGLRNEVEVALSQKATGMFRWAVCQLDILQRLHDSMDIREALSHLPATLDETYTRIFSGVSESDWTLLRHTIQMIYSHSIIYWSGTPLTTNIIIQAYFGFCDRHTKSQAKFFDIA